MQHEPANYEAYAVDHAVGEVVSGRVRAVAPFGVFVELAPNIQGLLEIPDFAARPKRFPDDYPRVGASIEATIKFFNGMNIRLTQRPSSGAA